MGKRANRRTKPKDYEPRLKVHCADGTLLPTTTWPFGRKDKATGEQPRLKHILITKNWALAREVLRLKKSLDSAEAKAKA